MTFFVNLNLRKGQAMFGDFIVSIALFLTILILIFISFQTFENQVKTATNRIDLITFTKQTSDVLFNTQGSPVNWNASSATLIGLGDGTPGKITASKLLSFYDISYSQARQKVGIGAYEFNLTFYESENLLYTGIAQNRVALFTSSASELYRVVNVSSLTWDLYAGNSSSLGDSSAQYTFYGARNAAVNRLIDNLSSYNTVIFEDASLIGSVNLSALSVFFNKSGVLVYVGNTSGSFISSGFGAEFLSSQDEYGNVVNFSFVIRNVNTTSYNSGGFDYAVFNSSNVNASSFNTYISRQVNSSNCIACSWSYLRGKIYFFSNFNASFGVLNGSQVYNLIGFPASYGTELPGDLLNTFVLNVPLLVNFDNSRAVRAKLIVWSNVK